MFVYEAYPSSVSAVIIFVMGKMWIDDVVIDSVVVVFNYVTN